MIMYGGQKQETEEKLKVEADALFQAAREAEALAEEAFSAALEGDFERAASKIKSAREHLEARNDGLEWAAQHLRYYGRYDATKMFVLRLPAYESARTLVRITAQNISLLKSGR
ncbi:MAG: hypothetical protein Q4B42_05045 [Oscillospiraceae bacterium]|nr:hypothetical protein [Oscillospiraceae bacterium]